MTLGERIQAMREVRGMTQYALAKAAGMDQSQLAAIEKGKTQNPGVFTVQRIAQGLGVSLEELIADKRIEVNVIDSSRLGEVAERARREGITAAEAAERIAKQENAPSVHLEDEGVTVTSLPSRGPEQQQSEIERIARAIVNTVAAADLLRGKKMSDEQLETEIKEMTESLESLLSSAPKPKP